MNLVIAIIYLSLFLLIIYILVKKNKTFKTQYQSLNDKFIALNSDLKFSQDRVQELKSLNLELNSKIENFYQINLQMEKKISSLESYNKALLYENENLKKVENQIEQKINSEFRNLATQIIEERSLKITEFNQKEISPMINQLYNAIDGLKRQAAEQLEQETRQRTKIEHNLAKSIAETNRLNIEANNLVNALNSNSKSQGDWGEVIVETILQQSGLIEGVNYYRQSSFKDEERKDVRPDFIIILPNQNNQQRVVIVDSKLSLNAFQKYANSDNIDDKKIFLRQHLESIKKHIKDLAEKKYQEITQIETIDFIFAFIPLEPAYLLAIQSDMELWNFAYQKKIILVSPTNFIACIKMIAELWRYQIQNKNAEKIVEQANKLYEKVIALSQHFKNIENHLERATESYQQAIKVFGGRGGIVSQADNLKKLGLKSNKNFSIEFSDMLDNQEDKPENELSKSNQEDG